MIFNSNCLSNQIKFNLSRNELVIPLSSTPPPEQDNDGGYTSEIVQRILAAKVEGLVSNKAYHEIWMALSEHVRGQVPLLHLVSKREKNRMGKST